VPHTSTSRFTSMNATCRASRCSSAISSASILAMYYLAERTGAARAAVSPRRQGFGCDEGGLSNRRCLIATGRGCCARSPDRRCRRAAPATRDARGRMNGSCVFRTAASPIPAV
jgi:hypothetical protein